jgi:hypothetical protein
MTQIPRQLPGPVESTYAIDPPHTSPAYLKSRIILSYIHKYVIGK